MLLLEYVRRRAAGAFVVAFALTACFLSMPGDAHAAAVVLRPSFTHGYLGEGTTIETAFTINGSEYNGHPDPLTNLTIDLPAGAGVSTAGFATCDEATLEASGPAGCPSGSLAGPASNVTTFVAFGGQFVEDRATLQAFFSAGETILFYLSSSAPVSFEYFLHGTLASGALPYVRTLSVPIPQIATVPGAPFASITSITFALGASREEEGIEIPAATVPPTCKEGFEWGGTMAFEDGTSGSFTAAEHCPRANPLAPILGQRQAVRVTAGRVSVRPRGANYFVPLTGTSVIPNGSELDTTNGQVVLSAAGETPNASEQAAIHGGRFRIAQERGHGARTNLALSLPLTGCAPIRRRHTSVRIARRTPHRPQSSSRHLWVSERGGNWGTEGRYVSTTVAGTSWLTVDECDRSKVEVIAGEVAVHDRVRHTTKLLTAGMDYVARRPPRTRHNHPEPRQPVRKAG